MNPLADIGNIDAGGAVVKCIVDGCTSRVKKRGMCNAHYLRWWRHGHPESGSTGQGEVSRWLRDVALHHAGDDCLPFPYSRDNNGYGRVRLNGRLVLASRWVCEQVNGPPPTDRHEAAHSCGRGHEGCVAPSHLSWKTHKENHDDRLLHGTDGASVWRRRREGYYA